MKRSRRRVLFLQCANAGNYPPIMNAAWLLAERGWKVAVLSAPSADTAGLHFCAHPGIRHWATPLRAANRVGMSDYAIYCAAAGALAMRVRPGVVYASDVLAALPALVAARLSAARLVYHEHDLPRTSGLRPALARWRMAAARRAELVVVPNVERGRLMAGDLGLQPGRLRIAWNVPRRAELPPARTGKSQPAVLHYHGTIAPDLLPEPVIAAAHAWGGRVRVQVAGYEAPSARGYLAHLAARGRLPGGDGVVHYLGRLPRDRVLAAAAAAHVGLALTTPDTEDINLRHLAGASNKVFDYMAAGLPLLVSDTPEWRRMLVAPGHAIACDPADAGSIAAALRRLLDDPEGARVTGARNRARIAREWNYEAAFAPVIDALERPAG